MSQVDPKAIRRKVWWRIVPLLFVLYIIAYLDRANLSFAKLDMCKALDFSPAVYGWGVGVFFVGYLLLEIPGAILVERWSARKWFARILVTWGVCSMGMALVRTPLQFYSARFLLGLAEAGFFPGVIVYFTHWFPRAERARALAGLVLGVPVSLALGARASGWLLQVDWFGLAGWQWVFVIEGLPAVLIGVLLPFVMTDRPHQARWLTPAEREWLEARLEQERREAATHNRIGLRQALQQPTVWLLALGILATNTGGYAFTYWLPTVIEGWLREVGRGASPSDATNWTSLIFLCGLAGVWLSGQSSDRSGERKWHCVAGQVLTGIFVAASAISGQPWALVFAWLCLVGLFAFFWPSPFWVLPTQTLPPAVAVVAIGFINIFANIAGIIGPPVVGEMQGANRDMRTCLFVVAGCYVLGGVLIAMLRVPARTRPAASE